MMALYGFYTLPPLPKSHVLRLARFSVRFSTPPFRPPASIMSLSSTKSRLVAASTS